MLALVHACIQTHSNFSLRLLQIQFSFDFVGLGMPANTKLDMRFCCPINLLSSHTEKKSLDDRRCNHDHLSIALNRAANTA